MNVRNTQLLVDFWKKHSDAKKPLMRWLDITRKTSWSGFTQLRNTFASADMVSTADTKLVIFNISGNKYRLITEIDFSGALVIVDCVLTHAEYDKDKWKDKL